ncbi:HesA/MoeB/ThiF family protein [Streptomyces tanashiensis]|uniref:ThiF family adenylyltransferase n=1 Tax=Streptomyces tanashiensis TaxID=67367 RepID=A0ABY6R9P5_9ACTN|nr:ThiF family adenylyltransferase [Streptomyces tanashiensis]UZX26305.1 ThiF family adenylyltransferase [Streptomyces tanashiensis]
MLKPRIKTPHRPHLRPDGTVWIGSLHYGLATELQDESGLVWSLCRLLDGTRPPSEITAEVAVEHRIAQREVDEVLGFLVASGWVEDAGAELPEGLSRREEERYSRSTQFLSWIDTTPRSSPLELQARLKAGVVTVLGVGGIGSAVASSLVASGVGHVRCVDHDTVELTNLNRQFLFDEDDVGRPKTQVAVERLSRLNTDVTVTGEERLLTGPEDIADAVSGSDLFLLCADDPMEIDGWANKAALRLGVPWIHSAYTGPMLSVGTFIPGVTGCNSCLWKTERERLEEVGRGDLWQDRKIAGFHPVMAPTAQMAGHFAALEALYLLLGMNVPTAGRKFHRNFLDIDHQYSIDAERRADCPDCGSHSDSAHPPGAHR